MGLNANMTHLLNSLLPLRRFVNCLYASRLISVASSIKIRCKTESIGVTDLIFSLSIMLRYNRLRYISVYFYTDQTISSNFTVCPPLRVRLHPTLLNGITIPFLDGRCRFIISVVVSPIKSMLFPTILYTHSYFALSYPNSSASFRFARINF